MSVMDTIKHAPRWTWYATAGISAGVIGLRLYKGRAAPDPAVMAGDASTTGDGGGTIPVTAGSSPTVITPPVVQVGNQDNASDVGAAFAGVYGGIVDDLTGLLGGLVTGDQANMGALITGGQELDQSILALAGAGSAPQPAVVNPAPVQVTVAAPKAPAPARPTIKDPGTALAAINAALGSSHNPAVETNLRHAIAHINSGHPDLVRASLLAARSLATGQTTKNHINRALSAI